MELDDGRAGEKNQENVIHVVSIGLAIACGLPKRAYTSLMQCRMIVFVKQKIDASFM